MNEQAPEQITSPPEHEAAPGLQMAAPSPETAEPAAPRKIDSALVGWLVVITVIAITGLLIYASFGKV
jgi:hypothetical protein